jgi:hypothetical protein
MMSIHVKPLREQTAHDISSISLAKGDWTLRGRAMPGRDFSCEILGLVVLTLLSALSHFWLIMMGICAIAGLSVVAFLLSRIFRFAKSEVAARFLHPRHRRESQAQGELPDHISKSPQQSLPVG